MDKSKDGSGGNRADREAQTLELLELLDTTTELICSTGRDGRMKYVNAAWCQVMGYTADEAIGQSPIAFVAPEDRVRAYDAIERLMRGEAISEFEAQGLKKDGSRAVFRGNARPTMVDGVCVATRAVYRDVSAERADQEMRARLVGTLEASPDFVAIATAEGQFVYMNRAGRHLVGIAEDADLTTVSGPSLRSPEQWARIAGEAMPAARRDGVWVGETVIIGAHGRHIPVSQVIVAHAPLGPDEPIYFSTVLRDLSDRSKAAAALRESEARFRAAIDGSLDAFMALQSIHGGDGQTVDFEIIDTNPRAGEFVGMAHEDLIGKCLSELFPTTRTRGFLDACREVVQTRQVHEEETRTTDPRFAGKWFQIQVVPLGDGVAITTRDITERKRLEHQVRALAARDDLTGVYNRRGFMDMAAQSLQLALREGFPCVLLYGDLDDFKQVNDVYGHAVGDSALRDAGGILRETLRETDIVGRIGGDEFTVFAINTPPDEAELLVARIEAALKLHNRTAGRRHHLSMTVGTALLDPAAPASLDDLLQTADTALYVAKRARSSLMPVSSATSSAN
ncbi:MAG: sensor domain-containing diguanylate cyclase [Gemmatimonadaceae bacterium]